MNANTLEEAARLEQVMSYDFVPMLFAALASNHVLIAFLWVIVLRY